MNNSRVFDRAAGYYDKTRLLPDEVATTGLDVLMQTIGPSARLLEAGVGTGRIGIPLWQRGVDLTGVDLSGPMMARLQEKYPPARLAQADVGRLPFGRNTFDAVLTVHVLHLVDDWRGVLQEFQRVLRPGGLFVNAFRTTKGHNHRNGMRDAWRRWLRENAPSGPAPFVGVVDEQTVTDALTEMGADVSIIHAATYRDSYRIDEEIDRYASRNFSSTWELNDGDLDGSVAALRHWAAATYGRLDRTLSDEIVFQLQVGRFAS